MTEIKWAPRSHAFVVDGRIFATIDIDGLRVDRQWRAIDKEAAGELCLWLFTWTEPNLERVIHSPQRPAPRLVKLKTDLPPEDDDAGGIPY